MNKIVKKFWGVALIVVLLSTLFVGGTVQTANGATLAWGVQGIMPQNAANPNQIAANTDINLVKVAPNGDIFIVDQSANPDVILKSVNGGRTWTAATTGLVAGDIVSALVISPAYATDGYVYAVVNNTTNVRVFQSTNKGVTFGALGTNLGAAPLVGTSIALDPTFNAGVGNIIVGLANSTTATNAANGVMYWTGAPSYTWLPLGTLAEDVSAVAFSPNFPIDQAYIAVGSDSALGTAIHVKVFTNAWDSPSYYPATTRIAAILDVGPGATDMIAASLVLPSDFNAANAATRYLYFATTSGTATNDDVYRVMLVPGTVVTPVALAYAAPKVSIASLSYSGTTAAGSLFAGAAASATFKYTTAPSGAAVTWLGGGLVSGAAGASVVANGTTVYVGTTGRNSAFNTSSDSGAHFVQVGYIDTNISSVEDFQVASSSEFYMVTNDNFIDGLNYATTSGITGGTDGTADVLTISYINAAGVAATVTLTIPTTTGFAPAATGSVGVTARSILGVTLSAGSDAGAITEAITLSSVLSGTNYGTFTFSGAGAGAFTGTSNVSPTGVESLWKSTDSGTTWVRIYYMTTATDKAAVRLSPAFATDKTMYMFEKGAVGGTIAPALAMSQNSGATFSQGWFSTLSSGVGINDLVVVDGFSLYAASAAAGTVYKSGNNAFWWTAQTTGATAAIYQLKYNVAAGDVLAGTTNGGVFYSVDGTNWASAAFTGTGNVHVAFDTNYATNGMFYAGDAGSLVGTYRYTVSSAAWAQISTKILATKSGDIYVTPDGALYAVDTSAPVSASPTPALEAGGVVRILAPTTGSTALPPAGEYISLDDGLAAATTLSTLVYASGSNILYSIATNSNLIYSYTDTLTTAVPGVVSPLNGAIVLGGVVSVVITPVTGATGYDILWSQRSDFATSGGGTYTAYNNTFAVTGVSFGATVYFKVRVLTPVLGPWSQVYNFQTQLNVNPVFNAPNIPQNQPAADGQINAPVKPVLVWDSAIGATGYELQLSKDGAMTGNFIINDTGTHALGTVTTLEVTSALDYSTTYFWRVRAISATSNTDWSDVQAFTTMAAPTTQPPPVTVTNNPPVTVTVSQPPATTITFTQEPTKQINPSYIWAIIIIGAVLVLAVIVLIVRTRRAV